MKDNPLVTVLLTVYNRPSVVSTVRSILCQTYKNFEFLIIDNASTDSTCEVIKKFSDERIRLVVNEKNMGQTYSLNKGLQLAKGKYIARIDADDIALPNRLEKQVAYLERNPEYGFCGSWVQFITDDNKLAFIIKTCSTDEGIRFLQSFSCAMYHPTVMFRKSILDNYNIKYNPSLKIVADYELWCDLLKYAKGMNINEVLLYYRRGNNNDSKNNSSICYNEYFYVREKYCNDYITEIDFKKKMYRIIQLEKKRKKSLFQMVVIFLFYRNYLRKNYDIIRVDYNLLKYFAFMRVHESCIVNNISNFAKVSYFLYKKFLKVLYKIQIICKQRDI